uniref:Uncharacterized protein n=1 Tax=Ditylenchus dipsaci TaxID=166011 RepID=A0A915ERP0_9BILA
MDHSVPSYSTISDQIDQPEAPADQVDQLKTLDNQRHQLRAADNQMDQSETTDNRLPPTAPPPTIDSNIDSNQQTMEACDPVKSGAKPIVPALYPSHSKTVLYVWIAMFLVWDVFWIAFSIFHPVKNGKTFKGGIRFVWSCFDLLSCMNLVCCHSHKSHAFYHSILFMNATSLMYYTSAMICLAFFTTSSFGKAEHDVFYGLWPELIEHDLVKHESYDQKEESIIQDQRYSSSTIALQ